MRSKQAIQRASLALLWQIYSRRLLQIHFRQCGHRCGGSRAKSSRMAWRTAGEGWWGGGPVVFFFSPLCFGAARVGGGGNGYRPKPHTRKAVAGWSPPGVKTKFFFHLLVSLLANPTRLDGGC